jgi:hypothetical protein
MKGLFDILILDRLLAVTLWVSVFGISDLLDKQVFLSFLLLLLSTTHGMHMAVFCI